MLPQLTNMLTPAWLWGLMAAIPPLIVALYFLKLRRQPLVVPSTYLWRKSIEDLHVNSLWQRLRRSLLLLLQLLLLLLLMVALINPTWRGPQLSGNRFIFLVDNSASMSATDTKAEGAPSRLDLAKQRVGKMIDGLKGGDQVMLISFSDRAETVQEYTTNHREARRRLAAIQPSQRATSLGDALRLAAGLANPGHGGAARSAATSTDAAPVGTGGALPAALIVVSDCRFSDVPDFSTGNLKPQLVAVGRSEARNVAITSFAARRYEDRPQELEAVARLQNFSDQEVKFDAILNYSGKEDRREVDLPPGGQKTVAFPLSNVNAGVLRLTINVADELAVDNTAWAVVHPPRRGRVLFVSPGDEALRRVLGTAKANELCEIASRPPSFLLTDEYQRGAAGGDWELIIYDRCTPKELPRANTVFINRLPPGDRWKGAQKVVNPKIVDTERTHPLVQLVEVGDFVIAEVTVIKPPPGGTSLFDTAEGSIFAIAPREGFQDAVLGFEFSSVDAAGQITFNTNWPLRQSFPVFIHELLSFLGGGAAQAEGEGIQPGRSLEVKSLATGAPAKVITPSGKKVTLPASGQQTLLFTGTDDVGVYEVQQGELPARQVAVNLFNPVESDIRVEPERKVKLGVLDVQASQEWQTIRRPIVKWLLLLALVVLVVEWYIYNRRVYV